ncbi:MAG: 2-hydroxyglutaryl-CoA dehydratase [Actinobacteria bacterium]|nr:2-hydroxyglutaryl-CoA dehydratase [Actinomycetota bacterium]
MTAIAGIGIDAGSTTCKAVAVDPSGAVVATALEQALPRIADQTAAMLDGLRSAHDVAPGARCVATGYGRRLVECADRRVTEITCHARGVFDDLGRAGTLVDIGGQDSKVIRIGPDGRPADFVMNDKCAAGTGRFLEYTAGRLGLDVADLGGRVAAPGSEEQITSTCTVFAESEIISLLARGAEVDAILKGLHRSLTVRLVAMVRTVGWEPPLMMSGGVARNAGVRAMIGEALDTEVIVPEHPQLTGAHGAALLALEG